MSENQEYRSKPENEEEDDDDEEDVDETGYKTIRDAVLFAIDVSPSMVKPTEPDDPKVKNKDSATLAALKCAYALMQQRIISHPNDKMGVLLFGTESSKFRDDDKTSIGGVPYPHCYLLSDLDIPSASDVKRLRSMAENPEEAEQLLKPSKEPATISNLLFCANNIFTMQAANFSSRRLFLVTDNDDPHRNNKELRSSAIVRAKDLYDLGVIIELFPISTEGHRFDRSKFYDDIVYQPPSDPEAPAPVASAVKTSASAGGISLLASLLSNIMSRSPSKRALFSNLTLEFSPDVKISVKGYIIFKRQEPKRSCYIWLDGEKAQIVFASTVRQEVNSGEAIEDKSKIKKAFKFGGELVFFDKDQLTEMRSFGEPVIRIIGFKPRSYLPFWANTRPATFIYPSEEGFIGSTRTFSALQQTLLKKDKMALVWFKPRRNATPVMAALVAGPEELDSKTGEQTMPPGLWICPLPFADDIRKNPETKMIRAPDILKDKMRNVVLNLQLPGARYDPSKYPNPSLQWHYRVLQAMALDEDIPETPEDKTIPRYRQIDKRVGQDIIDWGVELEQQIQKWKLENRSSGETGSKRSGGILGSSSNAPVKKTKTGPGSSEAADEEIRKHYKKGGVGKLTVAVLKEWLQGKGLSSSGNKAELVARVEGHFDDKMDLD